VWNLMTGNHTPVRFRALETLDECCVVATRSVKVDFDASLGLNLHAGNVKPAAPKESMVIVTKGEEL